MLLCAILHLQDRQERSAARPGAIELVANDGSRRLAQIKHHATLVGFRGGRATHDPDPGRQIDHLLVEVGQQLARQGDLHVPLPAFAHVHDDLVTNRLRPTRAVEFVIDESLRHLLDALNPHRVVLPIALRDDRNTSRTIDLEQGSVEVEVLRQGEAGEHVHQCGLLLGSAGATASDLVEIERDDPRVSNIEACRSRKDRILLRGADSRAFQDREDALTVILRRREKVGDVRPAEDLCDVLQHRHRIALRHRCVVDGVLLEEGIDDLPPDRLVVGLDAIAVDRIVDLVIDAADIELGLRLLVLVRAHVVERVDTEAGELGHRLRWRGLANLRTDGADEVDQELALMREAAPAPELGVERIDRERLGVAETGIKRLVPPIRGKRFLQQRDQSGR